MTNDQIVNFKKSSAYVDSLNLWIRRVMDHGLEPLLRFFQNFEPTGNVRSDMLRYCRGSAFHDVEANTKADGESLRAFGVQRMKQIQRELDLGASDADAFREYGPGYERQLTLELQALDRILTASSD